MSVFFISDLHLGHRNILKHSPGRGGVTVQGHTEWLVTQWNSVVKSDKRDVVWILGDVIFDETHAWALEAMKGRKKLVRGNHDYFKMEFYLKYFEEIHGLYKKYGFWMSHAPIHPDELRGKKNVHGHVHQNIIKQGYKPDERYISVCVEACNGTPIPLDVIKEKL